jgi:hypothetical protein
MNQQFLGAVNESRATQLQQQSLLTVLKKVYPTNSARNYTINSLTLDKSVLD